VSDPNTITRKAKEKDETEAHRITQLAILQDDRLRQELKRETTSETIDIQ